MLENNSPVSTEPHALDAVKKKQWPAVTFVLVLAIVVAFLLNYFKPVAEKKVLEIEPALAEFVVAFKKPMRVPVISQGSVKAKIEIKLVAEVAGRITQMAKLKFNGGFFKQGDLLLTIDDTDYRLAMSRAKAQVAAAQQQLIRVETEAGQAKYDLQQIGRNPSHSSSYALREPQLAEARANLQAAQAELEIARIQKQRTRVVAPFDGRVVSKQVDIGQYVSSGTLLADIYSIESVIVRLPLSLRQTELLGIKLRNNNQQLFELMKIKLQAEYAAKKFQWIARFSHTEGEIDMRNRLVYLVAEVKDPYASQPGFETRPPLTPGMFVKAELAGLEKVMFKLPRSVLRLADKVWLIDGNDQLQINNINIISKDRDYIYVDAGLKQGDRVISNKIDFPLTGMQVTPLLIKMPATKKIVNE